MTPLERKLIRRLLFEPETLSRNRNHSTFEDSMVRAARRIARHLGSVRTALLSERVELRALRIAASGRWELRIVDRAQRALRLAYLSDDECAILCEDAGCAARIDAATAATSKRRAG